MKPFVLVQSRPEDAIAEDEVRAYLRFGGLEPGELVAIRGEKDSFEGISLDDYSGLIIGGGPFNVLDSENDKSDGQKRLEREIKNLILQAHQADFPVLGVCYGMSLLVQTLGGKTSYLYGEYIDSIEMNIVHSDRLLEGVPETFNCFVGHKEACEILPDSAVVLVGSMWCPVQMFKLKNNIFATQFHPEVDADSLEKRILTYNSHGYFEEGVMQDLIHMAHNQDVTAGPIIIKNFIEQYSTLG